MNRKIFRVLVLICVTAVLLASCAKGNTFKLSSDGYLDKDTGVKYIPADWMYEPINVTDEIYGEYRDHDLTFFVISGIDPLKYVSDHIGVVYHANNITMPSLGEMSVDFVDVFNQYDEVVTRVTDADFIAELVEVYEAGYNAGAVAYSLASAGSNVVLNQRLKFADRECGFYYVLAYVEFDRDCMYTDANGKEQTTKRFLFDRYNKIYVPVGDLFENYTPNVE